VPAEAPRPVATPVRQSPAEYAVAAPHAWVAPDVEPHERRSRRPLALLALVAILIVGVSAFLLWRGPLRELISPTSVATNPPQQPGPPPSQPSQTAQQPAASEQPPEKTEPAPAPTPTAGPDASAPAGTGAFTVQVRSSPNEADARASAETLKSAGFDAYVARADLGARGVWYRVRVGRFASRDEAQKTAAKLRGTGRVSDAIVQTYDGP
jgi:cell division septation protein DedD